MASDAAAAISQGGIRYSQVWEDHLLLEKALEIGPNDDVLSVTSAGCNALALLLKGPHSVTAIDFNPAQRAMLELKIAAIRRLDHPRFAALVGARGGFDRAALYQSVRSDLSDMARAFWDENTKLIVDGLLDCGRLERFIKRFHTDVLPKVCSPEALRKLFEFDDLSAQAAHFQSAVGTPAFEKALRGFFGREEIAREGRDPAQFRYVAERNIGGHFWERFRNACTRLPARGNFYLEYVLTWGYRELEAGPPYLRPSQFDRLRSLVDRVTLVTDDLEHLLATSKPGAFSKANLSDVFEYISEEASERWMKLLARALRPGGRFAYWNLFVPRQSSEALRPYLKLHREAGDELWRQDRSWFYGAFRVEEVIATPKA